jgi:hypothetical protein
VRDKRPEAVARAVSFLRSDSTEIRIHPLDFMSLRRSEAFTRFGWTSAPGDGSQLQLELFSVRILTVDGVPEGEAEVVRDGSTARACLACAAEGRSRTYLGECPEGECVAARVHSE